MPNKRTRKMRLLAYILSSGLEDSFFWGSCSDHLAAPLQNHLEFEKDEWGKKIQVDAGLPRYSDIRVGNHDCKLRDSECSVMRRRGRLAPHLLAYAYTSSLCIH
jgi:hypothetical protein